MLVYECGCGRGVGGVLVCVGMWVGVCGGGGGGSSVWVTLDRLCV